MKKVVCALLLAVLAGLPYAYSSTIILKVETKNPSGTPKETIISANLPPEVTAADILKHDGLELKYDIIKNNYYVLLKNRNR